MTYHDEIELEDMEWDEDNEMYYYPCPCGDRFQISHKDIMLKNYIASCPSCSLQILIIC